MSADHACYAFQLPAYTEHFSCVAVDLPGSGESDKPAGPYSTDGYADQVAAFLVAIGVDRAHVAGCRSAPPWASTRGPPSGPGAVALVALRLACHGSLSAGRREQWRTMASVMPTVAEW